MNKHDAKWLAAEMARMAREESTPRVMSIELGRSFEGWPKGMLGGGLAMYGYMAMIVALSDPSPEEIAAFSRGKMSYGVHANPEFPHGMAMWKFGDGNFIHETPFNPRREETGRPDEMRDFLSGATNVAINVLVDQHGVVKAIRSGGLYWAFVNRLRGIWQSGTLDWTDYSAMLGSLRETRTTTELWNAIDVKWSNETAA